MATYRFVNPNNKVIELVVDLVIKPKTLNRDAQHAIYSGHLDRVNKHVTINGRGYRVSQVLERIDPNAFESDMTEYMRAHFTETYVKSDNKDNVTFIGYIDGIDLRKFFMLLAELYIKEECNNTTYVGSEYQYLNKKE